VGGAVLPETGAAPNPASTEAEKKVEVWSQTETNGKKRVHRKKGAAMRSAKFLRSKGARARVEPVSGGWGVFVDGQAAKPGPKAKRSNPISAVTVVNQPTCPKDGTKLQRTQVVITNPPEASGRHVLRCGKCGSQYRLK
jgi:hypothetical protein